MHQSSTRYVGFDVHKASIAGASGATAPHAAVVFLGNLGTRQWDIDQLVRQLQSKSKPLVFVSEAGPCRYWRYRALTKKGQICGVVAPSLIPKQPGDRGKTNRRDALTLARLMRAGDRTPVSVPAGEDDAIRDLGRARADALHALKTATLRRTAVLLRHDSRYTGHATWGPAPLRWRSAVVGPPPAQQIVCQAYIRAVTDHTARLARLAQARTDQGPTWRLAPVVDALQALRGGQGTVAVTPGAALGDRPRFEKPRPLMHSRGFTPAEYSTGERRRPGGITKTGHTHARRTFLEGAWASRSPAKVSRPLQRRLEKGSQPSQDSRWQAQVRRCTRSRPRSARGNNATHVVVAIARELRACRWASAQELALTPECETGESPAAVFPRGSSSIGRGAAPVWCNPRRRAAAATTPRA